MATVTAIVKGPSTIISEAPGSTLLQALTRQCPSPPASTDERIVLADAWGAEYEPPVAIGIEVQDVASNVVEIGDNY